MGLLTLLVVNAVRDGAPDLRRALRRLPRLVGALVLIYVFEFVLVLAVPIAFQTLGGPQLAFLGVLATLLFGLHFLVFAPVVAAAEDLPAMESMRRSARAGRLPGMRHFALALLYFVFVYWLVTVNPTGGLLPPATPSLLTWTFALVATLVHVGVLGAVAYRWMAVREEKAVTTPRPRPGR
jgi:hypothetical protein